MRLEDIDREKLARKLDDVRLELRKLREFEEEERKLVSLQEVVDLYYGLKAKEGSPLLPAQGKVMLKFMRQYPMLALYKGRDNITRFCAAYDEANLLGAGRIPSKAKEAEQGLLISFKRSLEAFLMPLLEDSKTYERKPAIKGKIK